MTDQLTKEKVFHHPIDRVWRAITQAEEISQWFIHADFKAVKGYAYTFTATEEHGGTQIKGKVLEADPYTLKYTWRVGDVPIETTVTWTLEKQTDNQTKLMLVHAGIARFEGETAVEMMGHFDKGWDACLDILPKYLKDESTKPAH